MGSALIDVEDLRARIERFFAAGGDALGDDAALDAFLELRYALETGRLRAAEPDAGAATGWRVNEWVKRGILLGFRIGKLTDQSVVGSATGWHAPQMSFLDKATYPARIFTTEDGVRIVPGGSSVRSGAYVARGVVMMPPAYINAGAYVDEGTMVDSHALVGSCAQIGKRVHLSAAAQIGGVLEPVNASPVIIEDDVLVGGNTGVYEGTIVRRGAVLAAGTVDARHAGLRRSEPRDPEGDSRDAADYSRGRGGGSRLARSTRRLRQADEPERLHAGDCEVSRREDGPVHHAGGIATLEITVFLQSLLLRRNRWSRAARRGRLNDRGATAWE